MPPLPENAYFFLRRGARGTFPPSRRASDRPMAMACFRLVTFLPERPDRSVPRFLSRIARSTFAWAFFPYFPATTPSWRCPRARSGPAASGGIPVAKSGGEVAMKSKAAIGNHPIHPMR